MAVRRLAGAKPVSGWPWRSSSGGPQRPAGGSCSGRAPTPASLRRLALADAPGLTRAPPAARRRSSSPARREASRRSAASVRRLHLAGRARGAARRSQTEARSGRRRPPSARRRRRSRRRTTATRCVRSSSGSGSKRPPSPRTRRPGAPASRSRREDASRGLPCRSRRRVESSGSGASACVCRSSLVGQRRGFSASSSLRLPAANVCWAVLATTRFLRLASRRTRALTARWKRNSSVVP